MAGRERLGTRAALSRLPRWVIVLGIVLVLIVVADGAALLAMGSPSGLDVVLGRTQTVVLKADGVVLHDPRTDCRPACPAAGGPTNPVASVSYRTPAGTRTSQGVKLPFTITVRVPLSGGAVRLNVSSGDYFVSCKILLKGRDAVSQAWATNDDDSATCYAAIPSAPSP